MYKARTIFYLRFCVECNIVGDFRENRRRWTVWLGDTLDWAEANEVKKYVCCITDRNSFVFVKIVGDERYG